MSDHELEENAGEVLAGIYSHGAIYPEPPVTSVILSTTLSNFRNALAAQSSKGKEGTAAKDELRAELIVLLRSLALYVQTVIQGNDAFGLTVLLQSGFEAVSTNRAQHPLDAPAITRIDNTGEGRVTLRVKPSANARMYEAQKKLEGAANFESAGVFASTRGMEVTGLTPGGLYTFRVRAMGGSTGHSDWSDPVAHRSL